MIDPLTFIFVALGIAILVVVLQNVIGPPNIPNSLHWIIWVIVIVGIILTLFYLLGFNF